MPPRGCSATTSPPRPNTAPYARRPSSQPKSSRQQFSACGACRMRRVRCDLKDLPANSPSPRLACSNCKERGINCVDEFADVKAIKLLRRGRRLQQVEAIYGKTNERDASTAPHTSSKMQSSIPNLHSDFFLSPFWRWFAVQRPILDATEFPKRFESHCNGTQLLGDEESLIAMLLVTWAESFGLDECGVPHTENPTTDQPGQSPDGSLPYSSGGARTKWRSKAEIYLREILELVDCHSLLRRPSLNGLRVLLLLLPLMEEAPPLERSAIHQAALFQVQALCVESAPNTTDYEEAAIRARLFWYAYTQEGLLTGLHGNRFVLTNDDLEIFQRTLPSPNVGVPPSGLPTPPSTSNSSGYKAFMSLMQISSAPLELAKICRNIHTVLTGSKAARKAEEHCLIDANGMREIWQDLDRCWDELDSMIRSAPDGDNPGLELTQFVHGWQIFIFECHNVIREALKRFITSSRSHSPYVNDPSSRPSSSSPYMTPQHLHGIATRRCYALLPTIIRIFQVYLSIKYEEVSGIFRWDAGLVRDGCFYAGYLAASLDSEILDISSGEKDNATPTTAEEAVSICLDAQAAMRWGYSRSDERAESIRLIWENRMVLQGSTGNVSSYNLDHLPTIPFNAAPTSDTLPPPQLFSTSHILPRLKSLPHRSVSSAPNTACSTDGRGLNGWPSYTPPGTATSVSTCLSSGGDSPIFANMPPFKPEDVYYHGSGNEMDQFSYNVPLAGSLDNDNADVGRYSLRHSPADIHSPGSNATVNYMASDFHTNLTDFQSCPQFGEICAGSYH